MKTEVLNHEVQSGNYLDIKAYDKIDAETAAQEYLDSLDDNNKYEYSIRSTTDEIEENTFRVRYNVYERSK